MLVYELMYVCNRDIFIGSVVVAIGMFIMMIVCMVMFASMFGGGGRNRNSNPIGQIVFAILAPIAVLMIQAVISCSWEFQADVFAARLIGDGEPLAQVLEKFEYAAARIPSGVDPNQASAYIVNPL